MKGTQQRLQCPKCGKAFFAWRPDELQGAPVKCYFCGTQFEDDAAKRKPVAAPASPAPGAPQAGAAPATPAAAEAPPAAEPAKPA
jgi:DNA-directed RNA polymerase subunit RPC12/RpoP